MTCTVRDLYAAFNRGDFDAAIKGFDPGVEFSRPGGQAPIMGASALREWMEPDALEAQKLEPLELRVSDDKVLVRQHATARGAASGIELDLISWAIWTLNDELKVIRIELFLPHEETAALEAAGLTG
jgi:hypothetical protein